MSTRFNKGLAPEDLSARARRGQASQHELLQLSAALADDEALRVAHQVGLDMDREAVVHAGDEELILRAASAALTRTRPSTPARAWRAWRLAQVAAAVLLTLSAGASAAYWVAHATRSASTPPPPTSSASPRQPAKRSLPAAHKPAIAPAHAPVPPPPTLPEPLPPPARLATRVDAGALFHAASAARGAGDTQRARRLYAQLIAQHPDSEEAHVAHVALGKLWLSAGKASAAEREFRQYLDAGGGPLGEEALYSRARALERLGRRVEERAAWSRLLSSYPGSVYAPHAQERATAIDSAAKAP